MGQSSNVEEAGEGEKTTDGRDLLNRRGGTSEADADDDALSSGKGWKGSYKFKGYKKVHKAYKKWYLNQQSSSVEEAGEGEKTADGRDLLNRRGAATEVDDDALGSSKGWKGSYKFKGYKKVHKAYKKWYLNQQSSNVEEAGEGEKI